MVSMSFCFFTYSESSKCNQQASYLLYLCVLVDFFLFKLLDMITVSLKAKDYIGRMLMQEHKDLNSYLRVGIKAGGCSGLEYQMDFDSALKEGDQVFEDKGIKVIVDMKSLLYLYGTELDYSDGLNGKGLFFNNPNASRTCSCGESFAV